MLTESPQSQRAYTEHAVGPVIDAAEVNMAMPPELWEKVKWHAARRNEPIGDFMLQAIRVMVAVCYDRERDDVSVATDRFA